MGRPSKYPVESRERAVRMVAEIRPQCAGAARITSPRRPDPVRSGGHRRRLGLAFRGLAGWCGQPGLGGGRPGGGRGGCAVLRL